MTDKKKKRAPLPEPCMPAADAELWKPEELEGYCRVAAGMANNWRARRTGPPFLKTVGGIRYRKEDVLKWLADRERKPEKPERKVPARRGSAKAGKRVRA